MSSPTREQIAEAIGPVIGSSVLRGFAADRVLALLSQPTPTAEPPAIMKGMRVRYIDGGDERIVGDFTDGAWDLVIPGTEKSRMAVEPEVFWQTVEPVPAPPSIADMVPGTCDECGGSGVCGGPPDRYYDCPSCTGVPVDLADTVDDRDWSTIRDVTAPAGGADAG